MDRTRRILGSWKEIAAHLGRTVRTVQRVHPGHLRERRGRRMDEDNQKSDNRDVLHRRLR
jgi:hypothetical protein